LLRVAASRTNVKNEAVSVGAINPEEIWKSSPDRERRKSPSARSALVPQDNICGTKADVSSLILVVGAGRFELPTPVPQRQLAE